MAETRLSRDEFTDAVHAAIRGVLNLYSEVKYLLQLTGEELQRGEEPFSQLGPRLVPSAKKHDDDRFLRHWEGRLYWHGESDDSDELDEADEDADTDDLDDEEASPKNKRRVVTLPRNESLLFAKVRIYEHNHVGSPPEPHLLFGVLANARVESRAMAHVNDLEINRGRLKHILDAVDEKTKAGAELTTKVLVNVNGSKRIPSRERRLAFTVPAAFELQPLYDFDHPDKVRALAERMRQHWRQVAKPKVG